MGIFFFLYQAKKKCFFRYKLVSIQDYGGPESRQHSLYKRKMGEGGEHSVVRSGLGEINK